MAKTDRELWLRTFVIVEGSASMLHHAYQPSRSSNGASVWEPPVDVFENEDAVFVLVALPGVQADEVRIAIEENVLIVAGESSRPLACREAVVRRLEIPYGRFERRIPLPQGRFELGPRETREGCLLFKLLKVF